MPHRRKKKAIRKVGGSAPAQRGQVVRQGRVTRQGPVTPRRVPGSATGGSVAGRLKRLKTTQGGAIQGTVTRQSGASGGVRTISGTVTKTAAPRKKKVVKKRSRRRSY